MGSSKYPKKTALLISPRKALVKKVSGFIKSGFPELVLEDVDSGVKGLNQIYQNPPSLIIVDASLPDISGIQVCRTLKHDPTIRKVPILLIVKEDAPEYQRLREFSLIADVFLEEKKMGEDFVEKAQMLLTIFEGLEPTEVQQLRLLQQSSIQVQALSRMVQLFDQSITEVAVMKGFRNLFELIPNKNVIHHMLFSLIENLLDYDVAGVFFNDATRDTRLMTYHIQPQYAVKDQQLKMWTEEIFEEFKQQSPEPWLFSNYRHETLIAEQLHTVSKPITPKHKVVFPFYIESKLVGALVFFNRKEVNYEIIFPFSLILQEMSALMRLRHYYMEAQALSITDVLTGLYTHQHVMWNLEREIKIARRHKTPLSIALISIDDFRELNIQWGYQLGDQAIKNLAQYALQAVRSIDLLGRMGGRKILAVLPNTAPIAAKIPLDRILNNALQNPLTLNNQTIPISLSIGIVGLDDNINSAMAFLEHAQKAVDLARQKGHNCMEVI